MDRNYLGKFPIVYCNSLGYNQTTKVTFRDVQIRTCRLEIPELVGKWRKAFGIEGNFILCFSKQKLVDIGRRKVPYTDMSVFDLFRKEGVICVSSYQLPILKKLPLTIEKLFFVSDRVIKDPAERFRLCAKASKMLTDKGWGDVKGVLWDITDFIKRNSTKDRLDISTKDLLDFIYKIEEDYCKLPKLPE